MLLKYAHIVLIFAGLALIYGTEILLHRIGRNGDTAAIRTAFRTAMPIANLGPAVFLVGVGAGVAAGIFNGYDMFAPWLLASYVLIGLLFTLGFTISAPWMTRVGALAAAAPDGAPTGELAATLHDRRVTALMYGSVLVDLVIVALMVFKPGA